MAKTKRRKKRRTAAQKRATARMLRARRASLRGNPKRRKTKRRKGRAPMARRKKRRSSRRRTSGGRATSIKEKGYLAAGAAVYGYLDNHVEAFEKIPTLGKSRTARHASHALALHVLAHNTKGAIRKWADLASVGAISIAGYNVGKARGDVAALEGVDDDDDERMHLEGEVDLLGEDDDDDDDDDDE